VDGRSFPDFADRSGSGCAHPERDIVLIAPGADLPFAWDARLAKAAYAAPNIAVAVPMCDVSPLYKLVDERARADARLEAALIDRTAYCMGERSYYEIPPPSGLRLHPARRARCQPADPRGGNGGIPRGSRRVGEVVASMRLELCDLRLPLRRLLRERTRRSRSG
jgi:hypothetical protein